MSNSHMLSVHLPLLTPSRLHGSDALVSEEQELAKKKKDTSASF